MEFSIDIAPEVKDYVMGLMSGYSEDEVKHRINKMSFRDYYELHVAYRNENEHKVVELLSGIAEGEGDNPYSSIRPGSKENNSIDPIEPVGAGEDPDVDDPEEDLSDDEVENLRRLSDLAGIEETSSGGCSAAGGIASAPVSMGKAQRRPTSSMPKKTKTKK